MLGRASMLVLHEGCRSGPCGGLSWWRPAAHKCLVVPWATSCLISVFIVDLGFNIYASPFLRGGVKSYSPEQQGLT